MTLYSNACELAALLNANSFVSHWRNMQDEFDKALVSYTKIKANA